MLNFSPSLPQSILILPNRLKYSDPLYKTEDKFSISTEECLTFQTVFHSLSNTPRQTETLRTPSQVRIQILAPHYVLPDFQANFPDPYNFSSRAFADILSASLSVYFTSIGRYFFSSFTFPEDLAISTTFLIAVRSSGLIFNTLL